MNPQAAAKFCLTLAFTALSFGARPDALAQPVDIASWDFAGLGSYGASPLAPTTNAANVTVVGLTRGAGVSTTGTAAANAWGGTAWLGQADFNAAVAAGATASFSVAANTGFSLSLSSVSAYNVRRSSTGPTTGQWQYRVGGGAFVNIGGPITWGAVTTSAGNPQSAIDLSSIAALQNVAPGAVVEFRIVNYGASGTGTWYLNSLATVGPDFVITGTVGSSSPNAPTIASFSPTSGASGTTVTITGTNFTGATAVAFNSLSAASFSVVNATTITAVVPGGARTGRITVTTANGTATSSTDFIPLDGSGTVALQNGGAGAFSGKNLFGRSLSGQTVRLVYTPPATGTVEGLRVTVPAEFGVPASANVSVAGTGGAGAVVGVAGQTVTITGLSASSPNAINVDISALSTPDTSTSITNAGRYAFSVDSRGSGGTFAALSAQPSASVLIPLANARNADPTTFVPVLLNQLIAVEGVCVAGRLGSGATSTMLQDGNLGIALYSLSAVTGPQTRGNRYAAVGTVAQFNGVVQLALSDPALLVDLGAGLEPAPTTVSVTEFNANGVAYQSRVIRIENLSFVSGTWAVNQNVVLQDPSANQVTIRIQQNSTATTAPTFPATVTGIGGQFDTNSPFNTGFQLQPRDPADLTSATLPSISVNPASISNLTATQGNFGPGTNFVVNASNLSNNITVTANDAVNFAISTNNTDFTNALSLLTNSSGAVTNASVFVRLTGAAPAGAKSNTVSLVSGTNSANVSVSGTVIDPTAPNITPNPIALSSFTTLRGTVSSSQNVTITGTNLGGSNIAVVSSNNFFEISANSFATPGSNSLTLASTGGVVAVRISTNAPATNSLLGNLALSGGGATNNVPLSGVVTNLPPSITVNPTNSLSFSSTVNVPSSAQSFNAEGANLSNNITVTPPSGFAVALTNSDANFTTNALTLLINSSNAVPSTTIFVRMNASAVTNTLSARNVTVASTGASTQNVTVSGTITSGSAASLALSGTLTNFSTPQGVASAAQSFVVQGSGLTTNVTVSAPANLQFTTNTNSPASYAASIVLPIVSGALSNTVFARIPDTAAVGGPTTNVITAASGATNATLNAVTTVSSNAGPFILANPTALSGFSTTEGTPSTNQTFKVAATNLTSGPLNIGASTNYEVSLDGTNFSAAVNLTPVAPAGAIVPKAGPVTYNDATNDIAPGISTGGGTLDIVKMEVSDTATDLVFSLTINGNTTTPNDWGNFMIGMANGKSAGATNATGNGWNRPINMITPTNGGMTHWIGSWVNGPGGGAQLWSYNGTAWQEQTATPPAFVRTAGTQSLLTYTVPLANLGLAVGDTLFFDAYSSGGGATDGAVDALSNTNISITTWAGPYTSSTNTGISSYKVGGSGGGGNVAETTIYVRLRGIAAANPANGTVTASGGGAAEKIVTLSGVVGPRPVITPVSTMVPFVAEFGTNSAAQSFTFTATNLVTNVIVTAPAGYQIAKTTNGTYTDTLTYAVAETQLGPVTNWVRLAATNPPGIFAGNLALISQGAVTTNVPVSGRVIGNPAVSVVPSSLSGFFAAVGSPSEHQSFIVRGVDLDGPISLTVSNSASWEIRDPGDGVYKANVTLEPSAPSPAPVTLAQDSASNYGATWTNGSTGGTGFGPWTITTEADATAVIGSPQFSGITGMSATAFGLRGTTGYATATRSFNAPMLPGDTFSLQWGNNFDAGGNGNKGLNIYSGGFEEANQLININMGASANITINGQPMFTQFGTAAIVLNFQYVAPGQLRVFGTGRNGSETYDRTFAIAGAPSGFRLYAGGFADNDPQRIAYANNFTITSGSIGPAVNPTEILVRIKDTAPVDLALTGIVNASSPGVDLPATVTLEGTVSDEPEITYNAANLQSFFAVQGFPSDPQQFTAGGNSLEAGVLVTPPVGYQVSLDGLSYSATVTVPRTVGVTQQVPVYIRIATGAAAGPRNGSIVLTSTGAMEVLISVTGEVVANAGARLTADPTSLPAFSTEVGTNSAAQTFILTGQGLSNAISLAAPGGFQISTNGSNFVTSNTIAPPASGLISNKVYVRLDGAAVGAFGGDVIATSAPVSTKVAVRGAVFSAATNTNSQLLVGPALLTGFAAIQGSASAPQLFTVAGRNLTNLVATNISVSTQLGAGMPPYELSLDGAQYRPTIILPVTDGVLPATVLCVRLTKSAAPGVQNWQARAVGSRTVSSLTNTVDLRGSVTTRPDITIAPATFAKFKAPEGQSSAVQSFTVQGSDLITSSITVTPPAGYDISKSESSGYSAAPLILEGAEGAVTATRLYLRLAGVNNPVGRRDGDLQFVTAERVSFIPLNGEIYRNVMVEAFRPPAPDGAVRALASDSQGRLYVGGSFGRVGTNNARGLARLQVPTGAFEAALNTGGEVFVLAYAPTNAQSSKAWLYAGGRFTNDGTVSMLRRFSMPEGELDASFAASIPGSSEARALALAVQPDGKVVVGGSFNGALKRVQTNGAVDADFVASAVGQVNALLFTNGGILAGGTFASVAPDAGGLGVAREGLARFTTNGLVDTAFPAPLDDGRRLPGFVGGSVQALAHGPEGRIYVGGSFTQYGGIPGAYLNAAVLTAEGARAPYPARFGGTNNSASALLSRTDGALLLGGSFNTASNAITAVSETVGGLAQTSAEGVPDEAFNGGGSGASGGAVLALAYLPTGQVAVGGSFASFNRDASLQRLALLQLGQTSAYTMWATQWFGDANLPAAAPAVVNNVAGLSNLLVFALGGSSPFSASNSILPQVALKGGYLTLTAAKNPAAAGTISYTVQLSDSLSQLWSADNVIVVEDTLTTLEARASQLSGLAGKQFLRLRIQMQP